MIEKEIRYVVKDQEGLRSLIKDSGAHYIKTKTKHDIYYGNSNMNGAVVRIRISNGKKEIFFKGSVNEKNNLFERIELKGTVVDPNNKLSEVLSELGLRKISENKAVTTYWKLDDVQISISKFTYPTKLEYIEFESESITENWISSKFPGMGSVTKPIDKTTFLEFDRKKQQP